jgi:hypothetical protein
MVFMAQNHEERSRQLEQAKSKSIVEVSESLGMELVKNGRSYYWGEHDSFIIDPARNFFYWNAQGFGGDPIKLVQTIKECDFKAAVAYLNGVDLSEFKATEVQRNQFEYFLKEHNKTNVLREYLKNERQLSDETIDFFISKGVLAESSFKPKESDKSEPVIVFKHFDNSGKMQGMALQGVWEDRRVHKNGRLKKTFGDGFYGMRVEVGQRSKVIEDKHPLKIIAFEAPIDLMSYYELHKNQLDYAVLVSMNGLRKGVISKCFAELVEYQATDAEKLSYLDRLDAALAPTEKFQIVLAVDNDEVKLNELTGKYEQPGQDFVKRFGIKNIKVISDIPPVHEELAKNDWNNELKIQKSKKNLKVEKSTSRKVENSTFEAQSKIVGKQEGNMNTNLNEALRDLIAKETQLAIEKAMNEQHTHLKQSDVEQLLENHFQKIEVLIAQTTETLEKVPATEQIQAQGVTEAFFSNLKQAFIQLHQDTTMRLKQRVSVFEFEVGQKIAGTKISFRNAINQRILNLNQYLKDFTSLIDQKFALEVKPEIFLLNAPQPNEADVSNENIVSGISEASEKLFEQIKDAERVEFVDPKSKLANHSSHPPIIEGEADKLYQDPGVRKTVRTDILKQPTEKDLVLLRDQMFEQLKLIDPDLPLTAIQRINTWSDQTCKKFLESGSSKQGEIISVLKQQVKLSKFEERVQIVKTTQPAFTQEVPDLSKGVRK